MDSRLTRNVRVEDYLNDKFQSATDFENLNDLLSSVHEKQALLEKQHAEALRVLKEAKEASKSHSTGVAQRLKGFKKEQADIDRRLRILTQSETSDEEVSKFDGVMSKLQRLEVAQNYIGLLREVERLSAEARKNFKASPQAALRPYLRLEGLAAALKSTQPTAEDAAPHLVDYVGCSASGLWQQMKSAFAQKFELTLAQIKWPRKDLVLDASQEREWASGVDRLLELQEPELNSHEAEASKPLEHSDRVVLLPLEIMARSLELRFRYHFEGDRPTNRPDRPEFFFSHVLDLISTYDEFFMTYFEPCLRHRFRSSSLALNPLYSDSTEAWITALLPMVQNKVLSLLLQLSKQPELFSHLIHETIKFDSALIDEWGFTGGHGLDSRSALTWDVLVKHGWFTTWLHVEQEFALSRYQDIVSSPDSHTIDYDSVDPGVTKPTKAAIRVNDLLETITAHYQSLTLFQHKIRFLIDIQVTIFDKYHEALHSSLEAYLAMTSSIARTVQGFTKEEQEKVQGIGGLERLCRVYGSAEYLERKMRDWNDNVFFIELWDALQSRARSKDHGPQNVAEDLTVEEVAGRTSNAVGSEGDSGALFDETAGAYRRLRLRTEEIMQEKLAYDLRESLRPYGRLISWAYVASEATTLTTSPELSKALDQIASYLSFLSKVLATVSLRRITRQLCLSIQNFLWDHNLMRNNFSTTGIAQFKFDLSAVWAAIDRIAGFGQGKTGMRKLSQAVELLGMPIEQEQHTLEKPDPVEGNVVRAREFESRLFKDNESARDVLNELGIDTLNESEARSVLEKRLELAS